MTTPDQGRLTDEEVWERDDLLLKSEGIDEAMNFSTLGGILTAIACGPSVSSPSNDRFHRLEFWGRLTVHKGDRFSEIHYRRLN